MSRFRVQAKGAIAAPVEITDIHILTRDDLHVLAQPRPQNVVQTLRDSHHRLARAVAMGLSNAEAAAVTGYSVNRVSMFRQDPAFKELVAHKRAMIDTEWAVDADPVITIMRDNALKAQAMLSDKLDVAMEKDEFLPTRDLLGIAELGLDRTGYGKVNKNVNVNLDFAKTLEDAVKRSASVRSVRTIETSAPLKPQSAPSVVPNSTLRTEPSPMRIAASSPILRRL